MLLGALLTTLNKNDYLPLSFSRRWEDSNGINGVLTSLFPIFLSILFAFPARTQVLSDSLHFLAERDIISLQNLRVNDFVPSDLGLYWVGTNLGLGLFDGTSVRYLDIKSEDGEMIRTFAVTKIIKSRVYEDLLYLCTQLDGLIEYNIQTGIGKHHYVDPTDSSSLRGNIPISLIEETNGNFWVCTDNFTLSYFDRQQGHFLHFRPPTSMSPSKAGLLGEMVVCPIDPQQLWIASRLGLYRFDKINHAFTNFPFEQTYEYFYSSTKLCLFADPQEKILWLGKHNEGLWQYDPMNGKPLNNGVLFSKAGVVTQNQNLISSIYPYNKHTLLVGSLEDGIAEFDRQTGLLKDTFTTANELTSKFFQVNSFFEDEEKNLWLGCANGLFRFTKRIEVNNFLSYQGVLDKKFKSHNRNLAILNKRNWLRADLISKDQKRVYLGTSRGEGLIGYEVEQDSFFLVRYQSGLLSTQYDVFMDDFCEDDQGGLWIGSEAGVLLYEDQLKQIKKVNFQYAPLDSAHVKSLAYKAPFLYIGTMGNGVFRVRPDKLELSPFPSSGEQNILPDHIIQKLLFDQEGNLWIGTKTGLYIYQVELGTFLPYQEYTGGGKWLAKLSVLDIIHIPNGDLYLTTSGDGLVSYHPSEKQWKNFRSQNFRQNFMSELVWTQEEKLLILGISQFLEFDPFLPYEEFPEFRSFRTGSGTNRSVIALPDGQIWAGGNLSNEDFNTHHLCRAIAMSRKQLHRKLKALTGQATANYIRSIRLQKAKILLMETDMAVGDITTQVGFKDFSHFSKTFLKAFGVSPSQMKER